MILKKKQYYAIRVLAGMLAIVVNLANAADKSEGLVQPVPSGLRVLTCGHSFHAAYVPNMLNSMARVAGIKGHEIVAVSMIGGSRVIQHWDLPDDKNKAKAALKGGKVDVLTLSPVFIPDAGIEKFTALALEHNPDVRVTVQISWPPNDSFDPSNPMRPQKPEDRNAVSIEDLNQVYKLYAKSLNDYFSGLNKKFGKHVISVVPCAQAVLALREKIIKGDAPGLKLQSELFSDDQGHPKPVLKALVTYCHFAVIYRRTPVGLPMSGSIAPADQINEKLNLLLQELAWEAVLQEPLSGMTAGGVNAKAVSGLSE